MSSFSKLNVLSDSNNSILKTSSSILKNKYIFYGLIVLLAVTIGVVLYYYFTNKLNVKPTYNENSVNYAEGTEGLSNKDAELMFFYTTWCPHCKTAKPEWQKIKTQYEGKTVNGYNILFTEVDCTNDSPDVEKLMNQYKIEGYPTIKLIKDGQVIEFDAKPTGDSLTQFINTVI
jgi:hypothetical protein